MSGARFWDSTKRFLSNNKTTVGFTLAGVMKTLLDNYWIFTSTPLVGQGGSEATTKCFYMLAQMLATATLYGGVGRLIDRRTAQQEQLNAQDPTRYTPLLIQN